MVIHCMSCKQHVRKYNINIICSFILTGYKVIKLKASSEAEAARWVHNIEDAITTLRTQYPTPD